MAPDLLVPFINADMSFFFCFFLQLQNSDVKQTSSTHPSDVQICFPPLQKIDLESIREVIKVSDP